jgi:hypothetical protein
MPETACTASCEPASRRASQATSGRLGIIEESFDHLRTQYRGDHMKYVKKIVLWTVVAFFIYAILRSPSQAADMVQSAWDTIVLAFQNIGNFFDALLHRN